MPTYKRERAGINYFSSKTEEPDAKKLANLDALREDMEAEEYEAMRARLFAQANNDDTLEDDIDSLKKIASRYDLIYSIAMELRDARVEHTVRLLQNEKADLEEIKSAAGVSWKILRDWADVPANPGKKKTGDVRVPDSIVKKLDAEKEEAARKFAEQQAKAKEKKS